MELLYGYIIIHLGCGEDKNIMRKKYLKNSGNDYICDITKAEVAGVNSSNHCRACARIYIYIYKFIYERPPKRIFKMN